MEVIRHVLFERVDAGQPLTVVADVRYGMMVGDLKILVPEGIQVRAFNRDEPIEIQWTPGK